MSKEWQFINLQVAALGGLLFLSLAVTWIILYYVRLLDHPNERSSHDVATPKCGGVGVVTSFVAGVAISQLWGSQYDVEFRTLYALVIPLLIVALISLADDIHELSPKLRLGVQIVAAMMFMWMVKLLPITKEAFFSTILMQSLIWAGGLLWLVGMANAFNFMDGIDGLAAGQALIASIFFAIIQFGANEYFLGFISLVLAVGCLGFLAFNFPPAKVFMGDVGSVSIGFILASLALISFKNNPSLESLLIMPLLMSNFIFDTVSTFIHRLIKRECLFQAHHSHLYQKFASCGFSQRTVTMTNYGLAILQGIIVLIFGANDIVLAMSMCVALQLIYGYLVTLKAKKRQAAK
jgi:UDP-GlcNAc:undecaprenyl-phosphate GlcNAc-1-phosphate transferase